MTIDEMIAVLQAAKEGKRIEHRKVGSTAGWSDAFPVWNFGIFEYRVKPEPREWWLSRYGDGSVGMPYTNEIAAFNYSAAGQLPIHVREVV